MVIQKLYTIAVICLGASIGATARYFTYIWCQRFADVYWATIVVNLIGSFLIGILFVVFNHIQSPKLQLMLMTGLLGSFTTFSTFSLDVLKVFSSGQLALGFAQIAGQVIFGISFCYFGVKIGERLL